MKNKSSAEMGSLSRISWVMEQFELKRFKVSDTEKLVLLAIADCPAPLERVIEYYDLNPKRAEKAIAHLLKKKLICYAEGRGDYAYELCIPED